MLKFVPIIQVLFFNSVLRWCSPRRRSCSSWGGISAPMGYQPRGIPTPFPKHCCTSVNHVVCHGIPSNDHVLKEGDKVRVKVLEIDLARKRISLTRKFSQ